MTCYRDGGCGPYEGLACNECPASKPEYRVNTPDRGSRRNLPPGIVAQIAYEVSRLEELPWVDPAKLTVLMSPKLYAQLMAYHTYLFRTDADGDTAFCSCPVELVTTRDGLWYAVAEMTEVENGGI